MPLIYHHSLTASTGARALALSMGILIAGCGGGGGTDSEPVEQVDVGINERSQNNACFAGDAPGSPVALEQIYTGVNLVLPLDLRQAPGDMSSDFYVVEKGGRILRLPADDGATDNDAQVVLQLDVHNAEEAGLLALALHPNFANNGRVFVSYVAEVEPGPLELRLSEFTRDDQGNFASERVLMRIHQETPFHFGGDLVFGQDGYLYFAVGDDGDNSPGDPKPLEAQNAENIYGSIARIDVDATQGDLGYSIPDDNPELADSGRNEVWAIGFRNPWRMTFDREAPHTLWNANVGASFREEINQVAMGENYGWPHCEGTCNTPPYVDPVWSYRNSTGAAVVGGYVYRGSAIPSLYGKYIFGGFSAQTIWALDPILHPEDPLYVTDLQNTAFMFADFAEDNSGELYVVGLTNGGVYRLVAGEASANEPPAKLSDHSCFVATADGSPQPAQGVIEYDVAQAFWSDGAEKSRLLAIPDGTSINTNEMNNWVMPPDSVTIKHFYLNDEIFETRFFVRYTDGSYGGYTYAWDADLNDATLVPKEGMGAEVAGQPWRYPARGACLRCHNQSAGFSLSLQGRQLNTSRHYSQSDITANQIDTLEHIGVIDEGTAKPSAFTTREQLADDSQDLERRVKSYLHVNCANCHNNGGISGRASWLAEYQSALADRGLCNSIPFETVSTDDERLVTPGDHTASTLWLRAIERDSRYTMPPLGSHIADEDGTALIAQWINTMDGCPTIGVTVPARIEAENYDRYFDFSPGNNGQVEQCDNGDDVDIGFAGDSGGSCIVGWVEDEEWLEYDFNLASDQTLNVSVRVASGIPEHLPERIISVYIDGEKQGELDIALNGWDSFSDYQLEALPISAGNHTLKLVFDNGFVSVNHIDFE